MPNAFGMENRPYVPKATVILNQDTSYEQLDIGSLEQRPFSQTVVEEPTIQIKESKSSLNLSKKSLENKTSRAESQKSSELLSQPQHPLNSLYSKTEPALPNTSPRKYLRKGEGLAKKWTKLDKKAPNSQASDNTSSKRSDS